MLDLMDQAKKSGIPEKAAALWNADPESLRLVSMENELVFRMKCDLQTRYLRITHSLLKSHDELLSAIDYQRYVHAQGAPICQSITSRRGKDVEKISHDKHFFLLSVNEEVQGEAIDFDHTDKTVYENWGKSLAHLHRAAKNYTCDHYQFLYWHDLWAEVGRYAAEEETTTIIQEEYQAIDEWLNNLDKNPHDFGLIHGNHRAGHVFYDGQQVRLQQPVQPIFHWFFADLAQPFLDLPAKEFEDWKEKAAWFLDGYYTIQSFTEDKIQMLPWFVRMQNLDRYLWLKNKPDKNIFSEVQLAEWLEKIRYPLMKWDL